MVAAFSSALGVLAPLAYSAKVVEPFYILIICITAGIGTVFLLPSHFHPSWRKVGGAILLLSGVTLLFLVARHAAYVGQTTPEKLHSIYFWIFSVIALFSAVRVVTHRRPVYSALYFVLAVFASAGLFVLLMAEFMAGALVIIYAGAILITYVFVIMLAVQARTPDSQTAAQQMADYDDYSRDPFIASAIGFALMGVLLCVIFDNAPPGLLPVRNAAPAAVRAETGAPDVEGNTQQLGVYLFSNQQVSLELAGLLLTIAMVGAIIIARRRVLRTDPLPPISVEVVISPATPVDDNPHSIPVYGTDNPTQKAYPET
jgi:NADH-quinone oxidoreductase subunit J